MISRQIAGVFHGGSRTYFYSSLFFPAESRADVFSLYAFVRVADDYVDQVPQDEAGFEAFVADYERARAGTPSGNEIVDGFVDLSERKGFDPAWTDSFLGAMRQDLGQSRYETMSDLQDYMYGSAEVIGLFMARVLELPRAADATARRLGAAMQYMNFLRDVADDESLGRTYVPREVLEPFGLKDTSRAEAEAKPEAFSAMMRQEIARYRRWQRAAEEGYRYLPRRVRIPIRTAADMYAWTADSIDRDPFVVFRKQVKPSVPRIVTRIARNTALSLPFPAQGGEVGSAGRP